MDRVSHIHAFSSSNLSFKNIVILVSDENLACEDISIGMPVLRIFKVDKRTFLEFDLAILDETNSENPVKHPNLQTISWAY